MYDTKKHNGENEQKELEESSKVGAVKKDIYFGYVKNGANLTKFVLSIVLIVSFFCATHERFQKCNDIFIIRRKLGKKFKFLMLHT